ncbi:MAG: Gfo/Idh/MocA family protein [Eubacteriaceae bacterium]
MKTINFGIVGFGGIAKNHLIGTYDANLRLNLDFQLHPKSVLTRRPTEIKIPDLNAFQDFESFKSDLDFVDICSPNNTHMSYVKLASDYNLPIYCEKPLSSNVEGALEMTKIVESKGLLNGCAFNYRLLPCVNLLKILLQKNLIGDLITFRSSLFHSSYLNPNKSGWRVGNASGGGALLDLGIHTIDLIHYIIGAIQSIDANTKIHFKDRSEVDEYAFCNITLKDGTQGTMEVSRISAETNNRDTFEIFGETGSLIINMKSPYIVQHFNVQNNTTTLHYADESLLKRLHFPNERAALGFFQSSHTAALAEFAQSVFSKRKSNILADFNDGLKAQRIVEMAYTQSCI